MERKEDDANLINDLTVSTGFVASIVIKKLLNWIWH